MIDIRLTFYQCFDKKSSNDAIKNQVTQNQQLDKELITQASCQNNLKKELLIPHLKTIFGVLVQLICS